MIDFGFYGTLDVLLVVPVQVSPPSISLIFLYYLSAMRLVTDHHSDLLR